MIILAQQTGRDRFNRLFASRHTSQAPSLCQRTRAGVRAKAYRWAAIHEQLYENEFGSADETGDHLEGENHGS